MKRLREGYVLVRNPIAKDVVYKIDLSSRKVGCIYLMTKDPNPMVQFLDEIKDMGHKVILQVTMNPYGRDVEPNVPDIVDVTDAFKEISCKIGKDHMIWRYDPVLFGGRYDSSYHERKFNLLCKELSGYTERCIFGFLDEYDKFEGSAIASSLKTPSDTQRREFMGMAGKTANEFGIKLSLCCSPQKDPGCEIDSRGCIDRETLISLDIPFDDVPGNIREGCRCVKNIDIGAYDSCMHDCVYCYANRMSPDKRSNRSYDTDSEMLYGSLRETDVIKELTDKRSRITDF